MHYINRLQRKTTLCFERLPKAFDKLISTAIYVLENKIKSFSRIQLYGCLLNKSIYLPLSKNSDSVDSFLVNSEQNNPKETMLIIINIVLEAPM